MNLYIYSHKTHSPKSHNRAPYMMPQRLLKLPLEKMTIVLRAVERGELDVCLEGPQGQQQRSRLSLLAQHACEKTLCSVEWMREQNNTTSYECLPDVKGRLLLG